MSAGESRPGWRVRIGDRLFRRAESLRLSGRPLGLRLAALLKSIALGVMRPDDLCEFGRIRYGDEVDVWSGEELLAAGLLPQETRLQRGLSNQTGRLLLVGVGGGREVVPLVRQGYAVTGMDYVERMVEAAREHATDNGVQMQGLVADMRSVQLEDSSFEVIWVSTWVYSYLPSRSDRIRILRDLRNALVPGGELLCQYAVSPAAGPGRWMTLATRMAALVTRGYLDCDPLDRLTTQHSFLHPFPSEDDPRGEFTGAGFEVTVTDLREDGLAGAAVLLKPVPDRETKETPTP